MPFIATSALGIAPLFLALKLKTKRSLPDVLSAKTVPSLATPLPP
jgi:hypothetical protein